jgi:hypothetical protein
LDNHLEKVLEGIFPSKSLFLTMRKDIKSLLELLQVTVSTNNTPFINKLMIYQTNFGS